MNLKKNSGGISAIELIDRLKEKLNKTTVYRVLEKLEDDGILHSFHGKKELNGMQNAMVVQKMSIMMFTHISSV